MIRNREPRCTFLCPYRSQRIFGPIKASQGYQYVFRRYLSSIERRTDFIKRRNGFEREVYGHSTNSRSLMRDVLPSCSPGKMAAMGQEESSYRKTPGLQLSASSGHSELIEQPAASASDQ